MKDEEEIIEILDGYVIVVFGNIWSYNVNIRLIF